MEDVMKNMLLIIIVLYILSPVDLCPGPIDDLIILLMTISMNRDS